ncbi:MAG: IclR family transcriptional regulator [Clostridiales bacterium]|nr:IclR family transcriptional regulator [Clostridiales bacterium]
MAVQNHRSLERALDITELISANKKGLGLSEICTKLNLPKSSVFSLVHTLTVRNYLNIDKYTGKYRLGLKIFEVGSKFLENLDFYDEAKKIIQKMSNKCSETVHLAVLDKMDVVYIYKVDSTQAIRMSSSIGMHMPAHATAIGKALLSRYTDKEIFNLYKDYPMVKITSNTITDINELTKQIKEIRKNGYAYEKEESTEKIECVAAPIHDANGKIFTAVSIAVPVFRVDDKKIEELIKLVKQGAEEIEKLACKGYIGNIGG